MSGSEQVFDWLADSGTPALYLHPLNLAWGKDGPEADLAHFSRVAGLLDQHPDYWLALFRCDDWREQLVAATCALVGRKRCFREEFQNVIRGGSWISPQLVAAFGLLHPSEATDWLTERWHDGLGTYPYPPLKELGAIREVLRHLAPQEIPDSFDTATLPPMERDEWSVGSDVASEHWQFWQPRLEADLL